MKNKRLIILLILLVGATVFFFYVKYDYKILPIKLNADKIDINNSFYEYCYNKAESEEQKKALDLLVEDRSFGFGEWKREALIIIGEIPKDTKRITIEDVKEIVNNKMGDKRNIEYFNKISGAPDWQGGSGISSSIYFLNDEHTEIIVCSLDHIIYNRINSKGELEQIDIEGKYKAEPTKPKDD